MKYLFLSDHAYLPQRVGGTKSSTHDLCLSLRERGHAVAVLARLGGRDPLGLWHRFGERTWRGTVPGRDRAVGYPVYRTRQVDAAAVAWTVERERPDLLVVQAERPVPILLAARTAGRPVLVYLRDVELHKIDGRLPLDPAVGYVANSAFTAARYRDAFGIDALAIPPLIRPERYRCATDRSFVTFVNPVPAKGSEIAFALAESRPDLRFLFVAGWPVGAAEDRARQARARRAGNIVWQASVQDMRRIYRRTRLLLAPSQWEEAWGRVVSEAQISAIPALASNRGGLPEAVGPGGVLVDHDAPIDAWRAALAGIVDDDTTYARYSAAAAGHAARPAFAPAGLVTRFEAAAARLVAGAPVPQEERSGLPAPTGGRGLAAAGVRR